MIAERLISKAISYEHRFDQKPGLKDLYLSKQIDSYISERLHVLLSTFSYEMKGGMLYGEHMDEPFAEVIKNGIDYREKKLGKNRPDKEREEAEYEGFKKIQEVVCDPDAEIGMMVLSISPKGKRDSSYECNFYDIFTLKQDQDKRFLDVRRYSSALTIEEYKDKLSPLIYTKDIVDDADWLKSPVKIDTLFFENADQIHSYLHKDHQVMNPNVFQEIVSNRDYRAFKQEYYRNPNPKTLDAIKNIADEIAGYPPLDVFKKEFNYFNEGNHYIDLFKDKSSLESMTVNQKIDFYGELQVREVSTGCGSSGSSSENIFENSFEKISKNSMLFSVSEFGIKDNQEWFVCPKCSYRADGPVGDACPGCGLTKQEYAKETGINCN